MIDGVTLQRVELLHPKLRDDAKAILTELDAIVKDGFVRFTYTLRTFKEQEELYAIGRTKPGKKVTNAPAGKSYHNYGLAVDVAIIKGKEADFNIPKSVVDVFKKHGWEWGGDFKSIKDIPHFQRTFGYKIGELMAKHLNNDTTNGYVNI